MMMNDSDLPYKLFFDNYYSFRSIIISLTHNNLLYLQLFERPKTCAAIGCECSDGREHRSDSGTEQFTMLCVVHIEIEDQVHNRDAVLDELNNDQDLI